MDEVEVWDGGLVLEAGTRGASSGLVLFVEGAGGELAAGGADEYAVDLVSDLWGEVSGGLVKERVMMEVRMACRPPCV